MLSINFPGLFVNFLQIIRFLNRYLNRPRSRSTCSKSVETKLLVLFVRLEF